MGWRPMRTETISYAMPTFDLNGRHLVHFAGSQESHRVLSVPHRHQRRSKRNSAGYKQGKVLVQFPLSEPLPADLIRRIVEFRAGENRARTTK